VAQVSLLYESLLVASRVIIGALSKRQQLRIKQLFMARSDINLVGPISDAVELLMAVREVNAAAVILPLDKSGGEPGLCSHLLAEFPGLLVLAISTRGEHFFLFDQAISRTELLDPGRALVSLIGSERQGIRRSGLIPGKRYES
jgi:hypothetical protein